MRLDNPVLVRWEYASEERLAKRNSMFRALVSGENPEDVAVATIVESKPQRVLDVGCGPGELTEHIARSGAEVCGIDISPRMVELTRARGIAAQLADVEQLPFADRDFDCVFAGWVLYHVPDLDRAVSECARVLRPGGRLVATTYYEENLSELWDLVGETEPRSALSFSRANGADVLARHFRRVEQRDIEAELVFPDAESIRGFIAATIDRAHLAPQVPAEIVGPFHATTRHALFVAQ